MDTFREWSCTMICRKCKRVLWNDASVFGDESEVDQTRIDAINKAFAIYRAHADEKDHRMGGHLEYHENGY